MKGLSFLLLLICSLTLQAKALVVVGDSISAGYGIEVKKGWVTLLQDKLKKAKHDYTVFNESISGDTSGGGLSRIDKVLERHHPAILILELGANDGLRGLSPSKMKKNLTQIIQKAKQSGAKVLLLGMRIPPNYGERYETMFYDVYPAIAKTYQVPLIPFLLEEVALQKELMQKDRMHPNEKAQPIIVELVWQQLLTLF